MASGVREVCVGVTSRFLACPAGRSMAFLSGGGPDLGHEGYELGWSSWSLRMLGGWGAAVRAGVRLNGEGHAGRRRLGAIALPQ